MRDRATSPDTERLAYSPTEVAQAIGCSRQFVYNRIAAGDLRSTAIGKRRFITRAALDDFLGEVDIHRGAA